MSKENTPPNIDPLQAQLKPNTRSSDLFIPRVHRRSPPVLESYHRSNRKLRVQSFGSQQLPKQIVNLRPSSAAPQRPQQRRRVLSNKQPKLPVFPQTVPLISPISPVYPSSPTYPIDSSVLHLQQQISKQIRLNREISRSLANQLQSRGNSNKCFMIEQLTAKNIYLTKQIDEYKLMVEKLQDQLREVEMELEVVGRELEKERMLGGEMKTDILVLLKKNELLIERMAREGQKVPEESLLAVLERERHTHTQKTHSSEYVNKIIKRNKKLESFAEHVLDMKEKVTGVKDSARDLKQCWRWLKDAVIKDLESIRKNSRTKNPGKIKQFCS